MKKIVTILCVILCLASLSACTAEPVEETADARYVDMESTASLILMQCMQTDDATMEQIMDIRDVELDLMLTNSGIPCSASDFKKMLHAWKTGEEEVGTLDPTSLGEYEFSEKNGEIVATVEGDFSIRPAEIAFTFKEDGTITSLSVGGHYTLGEVLKKAGQNTLIGMGTCFSVLTFIALIISTFGLFGKAKKKEKSAPAVEEKKVPAIAAAPEKPADDNAVIAVIAAAVAAMEGSGGAKIRSITRKKSGERIYSSDPAQFAHVDGFAARSIRRQKNNWNR